MPKHNAFTTRWQYEVCKIHSGREGYQYALRTSASKAAVSAPSVGSVPETFTADGMLDVSSANRIAFTPSLVAIRDGYQGRHFAYDSWTSITAMKDYKGVHYPAPDWVLRRICCAAC